MRIKRASIFSITLLTLLSSTVYAKQNFDELIETSDFYITEQSKEEVNKVLKEIYDNTGAIPKSIEGSKIEVKPELLSKDTQSSKIGSITFFSSSFKVTQQSAKEVKEVLETIYNNTGTIPEAIEASKIYIKSKEELNKQQEFPETRATSVPTQVMTGTSYVSDWSGTKNYTYTKYLTPDYIWAQAATDFSADFYNSSGEYLYSMDPYAGSESDYTYVLGSAFNGNYGNVYAILYNKASGSAESAIYELRNNL